MSKFKVGDRVLVEGVIGTPPSNNEPHIKTVRIADAYGMNIYEKYIHPAQEKTYEDGLNDAWETAGKIVSAIPCDDLIDIFDTDYWKEIFKDKTASEAIEKIKAWEDEKNKIHVGDVIETEDGCNAVVIRINDDTFTALFKDGDTVIYTYTRDWGLKKTGRVIDIEGLLRQIGGNKHE